MATANDLERAERVERLLRRCEDEHSLLEGERRPGFALFLQVDGEPPLIACRGVEDIETGKPIDPDTQFRIASLTKQFTCAVVLMLERNGLLSLDDGIAKYLPELRFDGQSITLRHLCWNTSGIRDYFALSTLSGMTVFGGLRQAKIWDLITRQRGLNFPPGSQERYSN
ncbi:MAG: serine hydrolase domain-containing protein, partial [Terriglobia bacterium]